MNTFIQGMHYARQGIQDLFHPHIRHYVYIPLLINLCIFGLLFYFGMQYISHWDFSTYTLPSWLSWLHGVVDFFAAILKAILYAVLFAALALLSTLGANLVASPFNGLLSEAFSKTLGHTVPASPAFAKMVLIAVLREIRKLGYYLPRILMIGILCAILHFIPLLNLAIPFIFFIFTAWMMGIQYIDYPADNHQVAFKPLLVHIKQHKSLCLGFGLVIALLSTIPFVNFIVMPAAVLGATRLWHTISITDHNQKDHHNP